MARFNAYIDEAANLADRNQFFIIGVVSSNAGKEIKRIIKRARRNILGKTRRQIPEIKFSRVDKRVRKYVIKKLTLKDVSIYAWIIDKQQRGVKDSPENYGLALAHVLKYGFNLAQWEKVWIDEKYNKERDKRKLEKTLTRALGWEVFNETQVFFSKSEKEPGLGLADFVAGAFYLAYNRGDKSLIDELGPKVVVEEKIVWREIKQEAIAPGGSVVPT